MGIEKPSSSGLQNCFFSGLVIKKKKKNPLPSRRHRFDPCLSQEDSLQKEMTIHSSILAWKSHEQRSVAGYSPWGCKRDRHHLATKQQHNSLQFVFHRKFRISWQTEVSYHWNLLLQNFLLWSRHDKLALRETSYVGMKHILDLTHKAHTLEALPYHKH